MSTNANNINTGIIRSQFPILQRMVKDKPLVYLDNAATTQKPQAVIDALVSYYTTCNANIHRGIHTLAEEATAAFEATRDAAQVFINAPSREEVIFTKGTTEGINLVAATWGRKEISAGDEIIISAMEHHSNIVPWQVLCEEKGAQLKVIPVNEIGELDMEVFHQLLSEKTKLVAVVHVSNALGTINPVKEIITAAHAAGAKVLIDGAQSAPHLDIDVQALDCDFFVCSAHKLYGPTGVGVLYGKKAILEAMPVFQGGGEMISEVTFEKTTYNELPYKYEAGTPNIADVIAFKAALDFIAVTGKQNIAQHEQVLLEAATRQLEEIDGLHIIGRAKNKASVISFVIDGVHPQDIGILLDNQGIALRTGHHCTQPLMACFGIPGTSRASFAVYNTLEETEKLTAGLRKAIKMLL
ncbi:cysteine desulfurase [Sediminibacterium ginsengisoli]|uniref:Cysteine desulfurase n=1 Tax=Sediminibacterium ginsengisoli TaxID=413434 RepID=A0A1T4RF82_9BACT|nr:cysteine desulfurase [Sediminibacterium ginsengisoli]SKA14662.1 cysteine desulfurase / selenocysteine lyase [Sediminibacterium ginsengisoli]